MEQKKITEGMIEPQYETKEEKEKRYQAIGGGIQSFCEEYCMTKTKNDLVKSIMLAIGILVAWFGLSFFLNQSFKFSFTDIFGILIPAFILGGSYWFAVQYQKSFRATLASRDCVYALALFKDFKVEETATGNNRPTIGGGLKSIFTKELPYRTYVILGFENGDETFEGSIENAGLGDTILVVKRTPDTPLSSKYCFKMKYQDDTFGVTRNTERIL